MSSLQPGKYWIVNMVPGPNGSDLAVEFSGQGNNVLVSMRQNIPSQVWVVSGNASSPQSISPDVAQDLHDAPVGDYVIPDEAAYQWYITGDLGVYVVQTNDQTSFWGLENAAVGEPVVLRGDTVDGDSMLNWNFINSEGETSKDGVSSTVNKEK